MIGRADISQKKVETRSGGGTYNTTAYPVVLRGTPLHMAEYLPCTVLINNPVITLIRSYQRRKRRYIYLSIYLSTDYVDDRPLP